MTTLDPTGELDSTAALEQLLNEGRLPPPGTYRTTRTIEISSSDASSEFHCENHNDT